MAASTWSAPRRLQAPRPPSRSPVLGARQGRRPLGRTGSPRRGRAPTPWASPGPSGRRCPRPRAKACPAAATPRRTPPGHPACEDTASLTTARPGASPCTHPARPNNPDGSKDKGLTARVGPAPLKSTASPAAESDPNETGFRPPPSLLYPVSEPSRRGPPLPAVHHGASANSVQDQPRAPMASPAPLPGPRPAPPRDDAPPRRSGTFRLAPALRAVPGKARAGRTEPARGSPQSPRARGGARAAAAHAHQVGAGGAAGRSARKEGGRTGR